MQDITMFLLHIALELYVYNHRSGAILVKEDTEETHSTWDMNIDTNEQGTAMIPISRHLFHSFRMHVLL